MLDIVVKHCKQDKDEIVWVLTVKLGTDISYDTSIKVDSFDKWCKLSHLK